MCSINDLGELRIHAVNDAKFHQNLLIHDISKIRAPSSLKNIEQIVKDSCF